MAAINDLIARIKDPELRMRLEKEVKDLTKQTKFGLVFEKHEPEMTLLYDYPISRGCKVIRKADDDKKLSDDILWEVKKTSNGDATCVHTATKEEQHFRISELICVAKNGEPIYPCLKFVDSVQKAPNSDLWHILIEADNYHALQLLAYLYPGMVDCIFIDPPYNSGATDWKYNNNYVDGNDSYRHSKWLAMMESRLQLAKKLLNPKCSLLIVTIDDKEYLHLGCLLEDLFPNAKNTMISSVINPAGKAKKGGVDFSKTDEYIFFIQIGDCPVLPETRVNTKTPINWESFRRHSLANGRGRHGVGACGPNQFYPFYIDNNTHKIVEIGEPIPEDVPRSSVKQIDGCTTVFPVRDNGIEMNWGAPPQTARKLLEKGCLRVGNYSPEKPQQFIINYLTKGTIKAIENGKVVLTERNQDGTINGYFPEGKPKVPTTNWNKPTHNATSHGTDLINTILCDARFDYPKSIYAVKDCINMFFAKKQDALIVDFFAGSGTTLHAVNLLNAEVGKHLRCIMVTNNEVSAEEEAAFRARGLHKGDEEWEKFGIARYVNWPRTKCSIEGVDVNGQPINGEYITSNTQEITLKRSVKQLSFDIPDGRQGIKIKKQIVDLINDKNMPQNSVTAECPYIVNEDASTAVLFDMNSFNDFFDEIHEDIETIYVVTTDNTAFKAAKRELKELPERTKTVPVTLPMSEGFEANAAYYKLTFLDKEAVSLGSQLDKLLSILWMKAGAYGVCPTHVEGEYAVLPKNRMAILIDEYAFDELKEELKQNPEIETVYIIDDSEDNYRELAAQLKVKNTYQLYRDYLDNFKINIERR